MKKTFFIAMLCAMFCSISNQIFPADMVIAPAVIPYALEIPIFEGSLDNANPVNATWLNDDQVYDDNVYKDESFEQPDYYTDFAYLFREAEKQNPAIKKTELLKNHPVHEIIRYNEWTLSFNNTHRITEWIGYSTSRAKRSIVYSVMRNTFSDDPYLDDASTHPKDYEQLLSSDTSADAIEDYIRFEKAQLILSKNFNFNPTALRESYYMGNVVPQTRSLYLGAWTQLDNAIQNAQDTYERMWVIAGSVLDESATPRELGDSQIVVPTHYFKVVLALIHGIDGKKYLASQAFLMPNTVRTENYRAYSCTIREIEELTGYTFFTQFDAKTAAALKTKNSLSL